MFFRDANIDDLQTIVDIYNSIVAGRMVTADTDPVTVTNKRNWFLSHVPNRRPIWVVMSDEGTIIGWVSFRDFYGRPAYNGTAEISIYLDEKQRGKGFGKEILQYAINQCPSLEIDTLLGFIFEQNKPSLDLFFKAGFETWGHLPNIAVLDGKPCSLEILGLKVKR